MSIADLTQKAAVSELKTFINPDACIKPSNEDEDLIIGENQRMTITIMQNTAYKVRNAVILGELVLTSTEKRDLKKSAVFIADNIFHVGRIDWINVTASYKEYEMFMEKEHFLTQIQELINEKSNLPIRATKLSHFSEKKL
ncbi:MAG: hypothetical protein Tsb0015_08210 [Simkaniaceae bacterium]